MKAGSPVLDAGEANRGSAFAGMTLWGVSIAAPPSPAGEGSYQAPIFFEPEFHLGVELAPRWQGFSIEGVDGGYAAGQVDGADALFRGPGTDRGHAFGNEGVGGQRVVPDAFAFVAGADAERFSDEAGNAGQCFITKLMQIDGVEQGAAGARGYGAAA
ncbi:hypothetical protein N8D56_14775 [Devosia sp. A8/3-2]|nr:hypothetical protein N8D56_14775 [Devosia sp. A8/3-2]